jgi:hypothetical protein
MPVYAKMGWERVEGTETAMLRRVKREEKRGGAEEGSVVER